MPEQKEVKLSQIDPGKRYRREYAEEPMEDLMESIRQKGLIQPIAVIDKEQLDDTEIEGELDPDKPYLLGAGGRRYYACLGLDTMDTIPANVFNEPLDALGYREIELWENIHREDLNHKEEVRLKKRIHDLRVDQHGEKMHNTDPEGQSKRDTAKELGESPAQFTQDYNLASAWEQAEEQGDEELVEALESSTNKSDALKKLRKIKRDREEKKKAEEAKQRQARTPAEKKQKKLEESYRNTDFFEFASQLPDASMDFVELDPPFAVDLENLVSGGQTQSHTTERITADDYDDIDPDDYAPFMNDTLDEVERVMKDHSWGICWFAFDWYQPIYEWLNQRDFFVKEVPALWVKPNGRNRNVNYLLSNGYEQFFYFRKGTPSIKDRGRLNYYEYALPKKTKRIHPAERPIELYEDILQTFVLPGANILSPFLGSGNIILAASNHDSKCLGCDLQGNYHSKYVNKVYNSDPGNYTSY
jgi:ParB/RepB/Spo0J family partition protein